MVDYWAASEGGGGGGGYGYANVPSSYRVETQSFLATMLPRVLWCNETQKG